MINRETTHWKNVLERLMKITLFLSKHNLAFRGSSDKFFTENNGNFLGLVELLGEYDETLKEHLRRIISKDVSDHYCGKIIQNELIELMARKTREDILEKLKSAKYYSLILDCTPDISHTEKMSFTVRFIGTSDGKIIIQEHFIGYRTMNDTTGESLTLNILSMLEECAINIQDCRGQGYDNGANMKGKNKGVQARILDLNTRAFFVPCGCHSLNLVVGDAAISSTGSMSLFGILQRIYVLFSASVHRWEILRKYVKNFTVKPVCDIRWECRVDSLKAV